MAAYTRVPEQIRSMWARMAGASEYRDMFLVEAVGPLLLLTAFSQIA